MITRLMSAIALTIAASPVTAQICCAPVPPPFCRIAPSPGEGPEVSLRASPGGHVVGQLFPGTPIRIQHVEPPWAFISVMTPNGFLGSGWVWARIVEPECLAGVEPPRGVIAGEPPYERILK
jgi:hypothetical protein